MTEEQIDRLMRAGFDFVDKLGAVVGTCLALAERGVKALERSAEAQERIAGRLGNMDSGYIDVRIVQDHD